MRYRQFSFGFHIYTDVHCRKIAIELIINALPPVNFGLITTGGPILDDAFSSILLMLLNSQMVKVAILTP